MADQGIKSRPHYAPLKPDPAGRRHLLLLDSATAEPEAFAEGITADAFPEIWTVEGHSRAIPPAHGEERGLHPFRSIDHLLIALRHRLARETMGLRIYAAGMESFLWDVYGAAAEAGMTREELCFVHIGSAARRILCVHCRTMTDNVTTNIATCRGCGAKLFVRDHFSRRLSAFMGVQVDAEAPGELPPIEELYL